MANLWGTARASLIREEVGTTMKRVMKLNGKRMITYRWGDHCSRSISGSRRSMGSLELERGKRWRPGADAARRRKSTSSERKSTLPSGPGLADFLQQHGQSGGDGATIEGLQEESMLSVPADVKGRFDEEGDDGHAMDPRLPKDRFFIETYGCQMNTSDSEVVRSILLGEGFREVPSVEEADVVFLNTCAIREGAEAKVRRRLAVLRSFKRNKRTVAGAELRIGVLGCMAERLKTRLVEEEAVDLVAGPDAYRDLPRLLEMLRGDLEGEAVNTQLSQDETYADVMPVRKVSTSGQAVAAFVSVMRGCSNMCSYCIVPFTRGRERSRPLASIRDEVSRLRDQGVKEVTLLGQNVNSYHDKSQASLLAYPTTDYSAAAGFSNMFRARGGAGAYFAELLHEAASVDPEVRVRFTSPHPKDFPDEVLDLVRATPNICRQLHLPAQSGSSEVLERMRRGYSREAYLELVQRVKEAIPGVCLSSDFITGFCGETEEDHQLTLSLMRQVGYDQAYMFAYSLRERTHSAYRLQDDVPQEVKKRRLTEVIDTFHEVVNAKNRQAEVGRMHLVLVEGESKRSREDRTLLTGRTDTNKRLVFEQHPVPASIGEWRHAQLQLHQGNGSLAAPGGLDGGGEGVRVVGRGPVVDLQAGDYACVRVTGVRGHTLEGEVASRSSMVEHQAVMREAWWGLQQQQQQQQQEQQEQRQFAHMTGNASG